MEKVKLKDIAERLQISIVAVSKALNDKDGISKALKEKVKATALEMGYEDAVLRYERDLCPKTVAVLINEVALDPINMTQAFYLQFFQKLSYYLLKQNFFTQMYVLKERQQRELLMPDLCKNRNISGLIFLGEADRAYIKECVNLPLPKILLDFYDQDFELSSVVTDNMHCSYEMTRMLLKKGHRNIGFVGKIDATTSIQDRYIGFYKAMTEARIKVKEDWLINDRDEKGFYIDINLPQTLPTAFVCNSDRAAYGILQKLRERGIRVPADVSVAGFDNDIFSMVSEPKLTTVAVNIDEMSYKTVELLLSAIEDRDMKIGKIAVPGNIIQRESVRDITGESDG